MKLSELIADVRAAASVQTANRWSDSDIAKLLNVQQRSLVRKAVEVNQGYHNYTFQLAAAAGRAKHNNVITYRLPPWVMKVASVRPSTTTPAQSNRHPIIPRADQSMAGAGWRWSASNEFEVDISTALDLELDVAKLPALMTKGTLPSPGGVTGSQMRLDADSSADAVNFPHESVKDSYAGAVFEITGPASARKGQMLRCVGSLHNQGGGTNETVLTMEEAWATPPSSGDTYEMHAELATEHCRLLTLLATRALLAQERNAEGIAANAGELNEQWSLYVQHVAERDQAGPHLVVQSLGMGRGVPTIYDMEYYQ